MASRYTRATWEASHDPVEMLRALIHTSVPRTTVAKATCACVRLVLRYVPRSDYRPELAVAAVEAWADGRGTQADVATSQRLVALSPNLKGAAGHAQRAADSVAYAARLGSMVTGERDRHDHGSSYAVAVGHAATAVGLAASAWLDGNVSVDLAASREASRRMAALVRAHVPWSSLADAYARRA